MIRYVSIFAAGIALILMAAGLVPVEKRRLYPGFHSCQILDRNGILLRSILSGDHKTSVWVELDDIAPELIAGTILREDRRFLAHNGIDILALFRATLMNLQAGKIVSGGSTITMQVAKMALKSRGRGLWSKLSEILYALRLEVFLSKSEILEIYLNRAPYGNLNYGVEAAATFYFGKPARQLSLGESCVLAVIPRSPSVLNPYVQPAPLLREKEELVASFLKFGMTDSSAAEIAINESLNIKKRGINFRAPHFVDYVANNADRSTYSQITSTVDVSIQENIEEMLFTSVNALREYNVNQGSAVVLDTKTGEILAMVGSRDYFDVQEGQVNGASAMRQPGSSIKPFLYILALQNGIPLSQVINDTISEFRLTDGTVFAPRNYGNRLHGQSRIREALASSFNIPTVSLLERVGVPRFHEFLKRLHFEGLSQGAHHYGLSLALGSAEVHLLELTNAYRSIANGGTWTKARFMKGENIMTDDTGQDSSRAETLYSPEIAFLITDILSTNAGRVKAFGMDSPLCLPFACAAKTGTSKNFRDNWCIGYTRKYTVGVWVGNFDGAPMHGVSGISGAAPLFRDIMIELHRDDPPPDFDEPPSLVHLVICGRTGRIAGAGCPSKVEELFIPGTAPAETCSCQGSGLYAVAPYLEDTKNGQLIRIINPKKGDIFKLDPQIPLANQRITFRITADTLINPVKVDLDGKTILTMTEMNCEYVWEPKPGMHTLTVMAVNSRETCEESVSFRVY